MHRKGQGHHNQELISDYIAEALGVLQIDNTEDDAFHMLGSAIVDAVAADEEHSASFPPHSACLTLSRDEGC